MNRKEHIRRHLKLHNSLDELSADMIRHTDKLPSKTSVMELMQWSYQQTKNPTEEVKEGGEQNDR